MRNRRLMLSGIVLAAGESRRMGSFKQLLRYGDKTMVEAVVDNLLGSKLDEVVVVVGHRADEVRKVIKDRPVIVAVNKDYQLGMLSSAKCGISHVSKESDAALIALADQPFIESGIVNRAIDGFLSGDKGIAIPTYEGRRGHPVIIDLKYRDEIMGLDEGVGLRQLMLNHPDDILYIEVAREEITRDLDYAEDYRRELRKVERKDN
jgi:molybdenum cofactor cytidylyltransferase